ncbi:MAG: phosphopantothenoylcysteine decarboxylase [Candidatus Omnitrophica bacterium]|nr:phosphopantothenoylcysteine decarboxylase [Candidatus Omnitrophota bacterium]
MRCIVTAGPTYEPLDQVRRLTNFSTGKLGTELANYLVSRGHEVTLLRGHYSTYLDAEKAVQVRTFTTTADLSTRLAALSGQPFQAVFHAAAVADFTVGTVWRRAIDGRLIEVRSGKFSSSESPLLVELVAAPKLIRRLRPWFPRAFLAGWKLEIEGDRSATLAKAERQIIESNTNACIANGRAYGRGFGIVTAPGQCIDLPDPPALYAALEDIMRKFEAAGTEPGV